MARVELEPDGARVVHVVTADETAAACPSCGVVSTSARKRVGDDPAAGRALRSGPGPAGVAQEPVAVPRIALSQRIFTESLPQVPARCRLTTRLLRAGRCRGRGRVLLRALPPPGRTGCRGRSRTPRSSLTSPRSSSRSCRRWRCSGSMRPAAGSRSGPRTRVTGRWRVLHDRWHTAIVDAAGTAGLLAHIDGRTASSVAGWLAATAGFVEDAGDARGDRPVRLVRQGRA